LIPAPNFWHLNFSRRKGAMPQGVHHGHSSPLKRHELQFLSALYISTFFYL
jgi:hypothetical protein